MDHIHAHALGTFMTRGAHMLLQSAAGRGTGHEDHGGGRDHEICRSFLLWKTFVAVAVLVWFTGDHEI